jgi:predicted amino acid racemase
LREADVGAKLVLLRTPGLSEIDRVIQYADISLNTELSVIKGLSAAAAKLGAKHAIILMIELGDLREGIMPFDVEASIHEITKLPGIEIAGIGASFACYGGIKPNEHNLQELSQLADAIESRFSLPLSFISGGNSANYDWFTAAESIGRINNVRLGESIYLGCEPLERKPIPGLYSDAFTFVAEVIEAKIKPSEPYGERGQDAFGNRPQFQDSGPMRRGILSVGNQDVLVSGLFPEADVDILGSSSDHTLLDLKDSDLKVGDEVRFSLNYGSLLSVMTSPYVFKEYLD